MPDALVPDQLARLQPLASLGAASLRELAVLARLERLARNLDPMAVRDWSGLVVYLLKGQIKLDFADGSMTVLVGGHGDALLPIIRDGGGPVSGKTITDVELLCLDAESLDIFVTWDHASAPGTAGARVDTDTADWRSMSGLFSLRSLTRGAFAALPAAHVQALFDRFQRIKVGRGEVVVQEGAVGDAYYLIERGRCVVTRRVSGTEVELAELAAGDAFGEEALVAEIARSATVAMRTEGVLLRLTKDDFVELLRDPLLHRLDAEAARQRIASGAVWLDVRFPAEYRQDGLPGAINIPLNELRQSLPMLDRGREYVVYCQTSRRSAVGAFLASQRGLRAYVLDGGLKAQAAGRNGMAK